MDGRHIYLRNNICVQVSFLKICFLQMSLAIMKTCSFFFLKEILWFVNRELTHYDVFGTVDIRVLIILGVKKVVF